MKNSKYCSHLNIFYLVLSVIYCLLFCHPTGGHPLGDISSYAQQNKVDSLLSLLKTDKEDTNKVNHLNALGWEPPVAVVL